VDSFNIALEVVWPDKMFFQMLDLYKSQAQKLGSSYPFFIDVSELNKQILFNVLPNGSKGYNWIISGNEFSVRFQNSLVPNSRPNVMIEIRSETIWRRGIREATRLIVFALEMHQAHIVSTKASRIDLCMDLYIPSHYWGVDLFNKLVSRSRNYNHYFKSNQLTGVHIGKGKLSCRLYDKDLEIRTISKKFWMHDVWGIDEIPDNKKVIRIEFQLLREAIKELGIDTLSESFLSLDNIWGYCTKDWLKFQSNPGKHHTQRKTLPWWSTVQNSFQGVCEPVPAIRAKAVRTTQLQLAHQIIGLTTSLAAIDREEDKNPPLFDEFSFKKLGEVFQKSLRLTEKTEEEILDSINRKRAKSHRGKLKYQVANWNRLMLGLPADTLTLAIEDDLTGELYNDAP